MIFFLSPPLSVRTLVFIFSYIEDNAHFTCWGRGGGGGGGGVYILVFIRILSQGSFFLFKEYVLLVWV